MKQSNTTLKELAARYRAVLKKCALLNMAAAAVLLCVPTANATDHIVADGDKASIYEEYQGLESDYVYLKIGDGAGAKLNWGDTLTINGGILQVTSSDNWIDIPGNLTINGGIISSNGKALAAYPYSLTVTN